MVSSAKRKIASRLVYVSSRKMSFTDYLGNELKWSLLNGRSFYPLSDLGPSPLRGFPLRAKVFEAILGPFPHKYNIQKHHKFNVRKLNSNICLIKNLKKEIYLLKYKRGRCRGKTLTPYPYPICHVSWVKPIYQV